MPIYSKYHTQVNVCRQCIHDFFIVSFDLIPFIFSTDLFYGLLTVN